MFFLGNKSMLNNCNKSSLDLSLEYTFGTFVLKKCAANAKMLHPEVQLVDFCI